MGVFVNGPAGRTVLLDQVDLTVESGEHWALIGPNGAGKTTLLSIASATRHPSRGVARIFGETLGRADVRQLRRRIGVVDQSQRTPGHLDAFTIVLTGASGTIQPRPLLYGAPERALATELLGVVGLAGLSSRRFETLSQGEQARVRVARALAGRPELLILDEPAAGLDLPGREDLIAALSAVAETDPEMATVTVAHGLEELPEIVSHACLMRASRLVASGAVAAVLTSEQMTECFGRPLVVERREGRYFARAPRAAARSERRVLPS